MRSEFTAEGAVMGYARAAEVLGLVQDESIAKSAPVGASILLCDYGTVPSFTLVIALYTALAQPLHAAISDGA